MGAGKRPPTVHADSDGNFQTHKPSTQFSDSMPNVKLMLDGFQVQMQDDPFEVWVAAVFRLQQQEIVERQDREQVLNQRVLQLDRQREAAKLSGSVGRVNDAEWAEAKQEILWNLHKHNGSVWKKRVNKFRFMPFKYCLVCHTIIQFNFDADMMMQRIWPCPRLWC